MHMQFVMIAILAMIALSYHDGYVLELVEGWQEKQPKKKWRKPWEDYLMFKKGSSSAPAPDPAIGQAALKEAQLGADWLKFAQDQFAESNKRQDVTDALSSKVTNQQLAAQQQAQQWSAEDRAVSNGLRDKYNTWADQDRSTGQAYRSQMDVLGNNIADQSKQFGSKLEGYGNQSMADSTAYAKQIGDQANSQLALGQKQLDRYQSTYNPIEDKAAQEAMNWDSEDRLNGESAKARADVLSNAATQQQARSRQLSSMGVRPDSGRSGAASASDGINTALAATTAENSARDNIRNQAVQLRSNAIATGQNIAQMGQQANQTGMQAINNAASLKAQGLNAAMQGVQANQNAVLQGNSQALQAKNLGLAASGLGSTSAGLSMSNQAAGYQGLGAGISAGSSALNSNLAANSSWNSGNQIMAQGYQGAMSGYGNQANILNSQYGNQLSAWSAQQQANSSSMGGMMSGLGSMAGMGMMAY